MSSKSMIKMPSRKGWCAVWFDSKGKQHVINDSWSRTKARAQRIADEYMFINQVQTDITECVF